jgi:hypothetical protein
MTGMLRGHVLPAGQVVPSTQVPSGQVMLPEGQREGVMQSAMSVLQLRSEHMTGAEVGQVIC